MGKSSENFAISITSNNKGSAKGIITPDPDIGPFIGDKIVWSASKSGYKASPNQSIRITQNKFKYPIDRFTMETKRQLDVLNKHLAKNEYFAGNDYSIADMAIFPWYGALVKGKLYDAAEFLSVHEYKNVLRWADQLIKRETVLKGRLVNRTWGEEQVRERHSEKDFDGLNLNYE